MQYFILRKIKIWGKDQYSIEAKAQNGYDSITEVTQKKVALETLNDSKDDNSESKFLLFEESLRIISFFLSFLAKHRFLYVLC